VRILPRDQEFFAMFDKLAKRLTAAAKLLHQLFLEPARLDELVAGIKAIEHEADDLTREIIARIDKTFVTPIDREDIHLLASRLDNVIDLLDGTARRTQIFRITQSQEASRRQADVLVRAGNAIEAAVVSVRRPRIVAEQTRDIKKLEEEGDAVYTMRSKRFSRARRIRSRSSSGRRSSIRWRTRSTSARTWPTSSRASHSSTARP
jgi:hypothetical protein